VRARARPTCCRGGRQGWELATGPPKKAGAWSSVVDGADAVVHLAGAGVLDEPWTPERKGGPSLEPDPLHRAAGAGHRARREEAARLRERLRGRVLRHPTPTSVLTESRPRGRFPRPPGGRLGGRRGTGQGRRRPRQSSPASALVLGAQRRHAPRRCCRRSRRSSGVPWERVQQYHGGTTSSTRCGRSRHALRHRTSAVPQPQRRPSRSP